jgi:hypothetical protein
MASPSDGQGESSADNSPYSGLSSYGSFLSKELASEDVPVFKGEVFDCEECGVPSPYVRNYSLPTVVLLPPVAVFWKVNGMMKCPRCMRRHILLRLPLAILASNLASPIVAIWWLIVFFKTFSHPPGREDKLTE